MILVWMILLCVGLYFSLGFYFSLGQKVIPYVSLTKTQYKTPTDYLSDVYATQGVLLEGMTTESEGNTDVVGADTTVFKECVGTDYECSKTDCESKYGYCSDNYTEKTDADGSNCKSETDATPTETPMSCAASTYGCCPDNYTVKNADGSSCAPVPTFTTIYTSGPIYTTAPTSTSTSTSTSPTSTSTSTSPTFTSTSTSPTSTSTSSDTSQLPTPTPTQTSCSVSTYGCCPDNYTVKNADGSSCASYPTTSTATPVTLLPSVPTTPTPLPLPSNDTSTVFLTGPSRTALTCPEPQPCPPCGRCPEPSFDCKKVPNYSSTNSEYLPIPVLTDFSQFGM